MKILRIIESLDPQKGGPAYSVRESSTLLQERGHEVTVVTLDHSARKLSAEVNFTYIKLGPGFGAFGINKGFYKWILDNAKYFDFVTVHGIWQWPSLAYRFAAPKGQCVIVMPHGSLDVWDRKIRPINFLLKRIYWRIFELPLYKRAVCCYFTSDMERRAAMEQFRFSQVRCDVVPYGSNPVGEARLFTSEEDRHTFGYMGRLHPKKGIDVLIQAFAQFKKTGRPGTLKIAGSGDPQYVEVLRDMAAKFGVSEDIEWAGAVSGSKKSDFLRSLGLFVLPSHQENFGVAVAEAMSAGTPVFVSDQVNIFEIVVQCRGGIVAGRDVSEFAAGMIGWYDSLSIDNEWRVNARNCFEKHLSLAGFVSQLEYEFMNGKSHE